LFGIGGIGHTRSIKLVFANLDAVTRANQKFTSSVYHNTEYDWDPLKGYHELKNFRCKHSEIDVQWVKGHTDCEKQPMDKYEILTVEVNLLAD
jgi:hypothetical protein